MSLISNYISCDIVDKKSPLILLALSVCASAPTDGKFLNSKFALASEVTVNVLSCKTLLLTFVSSKNAKTFVSVSC
nr:MAG: hypothetical protein CM15mV30_1590 [uncultured marine virus]